MLTIQKNWRQTETLTQSLHFSLTTTLRLSVDLKKLFLGEMVESTQCVTSGRQSFMQRLRDQYHVSPYYVIFLLLAARQGEKAHRRHSFHLLLIYLVSKCSEAANSDAKQ